jgi:hypothetical protein
MDSSSGYYICVGQRENAKRKRLICESKANHRNQRHHSAQPHRGPHTGRTYVVVLFWGTPLFIGESEKRSIEKKASTGQVANVRRTRVKNQRQSGKSFVYFTYISVAWVVSFFLQERKMKMSERVIKNSWCSYTMINIHDNACITYRYLQYS